MPRITAVDPAAATGAARNLLDAVHSKLGLTPNLMRTLANAPSALEGIPRSERRACEWCARSQVS